MTRRRLTDDDVSRLSLSAARAELMEEIMRVDGTRTTETPVRLRPRQKGWVAALGAAAAVAVLAGAAFVLPGLGGDDGGGDRATAPATAPASAGTEAPSITPAPEGSREWVVLQDEGWTVTYVSDDPSWREVNYEKGKQQLGISLVGADARESYVEDRSLINAPERDPGTQVRVLGGEGLLWPYSARDHTTIGAVEDGRYPEVRGTGMDRSAYLALLDRLVWVDEETFQSTLPDDGFTDDTSREAVIQEMLAGVPVPIDMEPVTSEEIDRYQLGADVAGAVACAWLDQFAEAKESGDKDAARSARQALATSRDWPVLQEMADQGDYPVVVWEMSDQVGRGEVPEGYAGGLGCP